MGIGFSKNVVAPIRLRSYYRGEIYDCRCETKGHSEVMFLLVRKRKLHLQRKLGIAPIL